LVRALGFRDLVLFYVVTSISLRWIATAATAGPSAIVIWLLAWAGFFVPLALSVLELSSRFPEEGGLYSWSKRAFGDFTGFMTGWTYWASNLPYYPGVLYFTAANALYISGSHWTRFADSRGYFIVFSVLGLALATFLNVVGLGVGKWLHNLGAVGTWAPIAILIGMGSVAWYKFGSASRFSASSLMPSTHLKDVIFYSTIVFGLGGCESASFMGGEIQNPRRNIPRALLVGGVLVTVGYILGTVAVLWALPQSQVTGLEGIMQAVSQISNRLGMGWIIGLAALLITVSNLGAVGAWLTSTARLPFVAGIDHYLPKPFGKLHPKWKTPYVALLVEAICGIVFAVLGQAGTSVKGAYDVLVSMGIITYFLPYLALFATMIKVQDEPTAPEVIRVPGGRTVARLLATVGFVTTTITIVLSCFPGPDDTNKLLAVIKVLGLTGIMLAVGAALYFAGKRRAQAENSIAAS
jgi:glutamate:GABA antiporter